MRQVIGIHACLEALKVNAEHVKQCFLRKNWNTNSDLKKLAQKVQNLKIPFKIVGDRTLDRFGSQHQGVVLVVKKAPQWEGNLTSQSSERVVLILDEIGDPQNLGAMLRTAWLMGVEALFLPEHRSVGLTATVSKVASGAVEHVPVQKEKNLVRRIESLKKEGFWVYGLFQKAKTCFWDVSLPEKVAWVVGSETKGLRPSVTKACDELVAIPQKNDQASFNASIAVALALSETRRQWDINQKSSY